MCVSLHAPFIVESGHQPQLCGDLSLHGYAYFLDFLPSIWGLTGVEGWEVEQLQFSGWRSQVHKGLKYYSLLGFVIEIGWV